jgi:Omp85 superfamily domain
MRISGLLKLSIATAVVVSLAAPIAAQQAEPTRRATIEQAQAAKVKDIRPPVPTAGERVMIKAEDILVRGGLKWHPFFQSAYAGGGFTLGGGYMHHVSAYNTLDARASYTFSGYKRAEVAFIAPRLFQRRGSLAVVGGWREATQVGFYGIGPDTLEEARTNYLFQQPYGTATLELWPARKLLYLRGEVEVSKWSQEPGEGSHPSVETVYTPESLPGLGASPRYVHTQGTIGLDWRTSAGYSRRGGFLGVTLHDYTDNDDQFGFRQVDYEVIQHLPILRETWALSLHGLAQMARTKDGQDIPFFMLPSLGGGSNLRGFASWRFRDQNSLLLQAEWRIMVNRFIDTAFFYDTGKVAARASDLDLKDLRHDYGFGIRFHGPVSTPLRIDFARSNESSLSIVFSSSAVF